MPRGIKDIVTILASIIIFAVIFVFFFKFLDNIFFNQNEQLVSSGISAFAGAFFAFLFLRLGEGLTKIYARHLKYYNALVKLEFLLNRNFNSISHNKSIINDFRNIISDTKNLRKIIVNPRHFKAFLSIDEILFSLIGQKTINNFFSYNFDISKLNEDFATINRWYADLAKLSIDTKDVDTYIHNLDYLEKHANALDKFLNKLDDRTKQRAAEVRVLIQSHKPVFTKFMFLLLPSKEPKNFEKKVKKEKKLLIEEMQKTYEENKKEIEDILE